MKPILLKVNDINGRKRVIDFTAPDISLEQGDGFITVHLDDENRFHVPGDVEALQAQINGEKLPVILICPKVTEGVIFITFGRPNSRPEG